MLLLASQEDGGGSGPGGTQVAEGGTGGDRLARRDRDITGSEVMGRSMCSGMGCVGWSDDWGFSLLRWYAFSSV